MCPVSHSELDVAICSIGLLMEPACVLHARSFVVASPHRIKKDGVQTRLNVEKAPYLKRTRKETDIPSLLLEKVHKPVHTIFFHGVCQIHESMIENARYCGRMQITSGLLFL
mmetsp:Transcript_546/g.1282  ORF Transcript_546/g.1282 Transcript_546/m.1282 type:complete len:112 (+) Transcript_546:217-552(+)